MRRLGVLLALRWGALTGTASAAALGLGLLACLCTLLAVVGPRAAAQLSTGAFRQFIAAAPAAEKAVVGSIDDSTLSTGQPEGLSAGQIQRAGDQLRRNLHGLPLAPAAADWSSLTTPLVGVTDHAPALQAAMPPKLEVSYWDTLASNVRVVAGRLPAGQPGGATTVLQVAVTAPTARRFGLAVGSRLALPGTGIVLAVTGIVRPRNPAALFWTVDSVMASPALVYAGQYDFWIGGVFIAADAVGALQGRIDTTTTQVTWMFPLDLGQLTALQASQLRLRMAGALATGGLLTAATTTSRCAARTTQTRDQAGRSFRVAARCSAHGLQIPIPITMTSGTESLLAEFAADQGSADSVLDLLWVSLAVLAAVVVLLAGWLLAEQRRQEFAVLRARGAARRQLAVVVFGGSAVTVLPGAAAGVAVGVALTPASPVPLSWWLAGLEVLASLAGPVLFTVRIHRGYALAARPDQSAGRVSPARRLVIEAALVAGAAGGLVVLRDQGLGGGGDLYLSAAPALLAIGVAVIVLRVYPVPVRWLLRLAGRRGGATAFLGLARAARVPASAALPAFAMVLALALVSFAGMVSGAVLRGETAASWQQAGADAVISDTGAVSPALQRAVAAVPGVQRVTAAAIATGSSVGAEFSVLLVDPAAYTRLVAATPLPSPPAAFTASAAQRGPAGPMPALASAGLAAELGHGLVSVLLDGQRNVRVRVVGQAASMSAVAAIGGSAGYLVLNRRVAGGVGAAPDMLLVVGPGLSRSALAAAVARHGPGATILLRSRLLAGLETAPLQHVGSVTLALGAAAAAVCCLLVLLLSLQLSAPSRRLALARMSTMGLSAAQGRLLAVIEALPQLLAVLAGGLACAAALVTLVGPALSLTVFTGSASSVQVRIEPAWLAVTAAGLLVLVVATLTGQAMLTGRNAARSLRIGQ